MKGIYKNGYSYLHMLNPRSKLLFIAGISLLVYSAPPPGLGLLLIFVVLLAFACGISLIRFAAGLRPFLIFFTAIFVFHMVLTPGDPLIEGYSIPTAIGLYTGSVLVLRFILLILFGTVLIFTTSPSELNMAAAYFLKPLGTFGTDLAFMVGVAVTFIPQLFMEKDIIIKAQTARGFSPGRLKSVTAFMVPLLFKSLRKADELCEALESRCYHKKRKYYYYSSNLTHRDFIAGVVFIGLVVVINSLT
jgi:energy-coupling factor transport system permease protein